MNYIAITSSDELWCKVRNYAESCSWRAGKVLANTMDNNAFQDWERVVVAIDNEKICGYCTVAKTDCIPNVPYTPYIGFMFVDEAYRGNRLSQQIICYAMDYLKSVGFDKVYLVSEYAKDTILISAGKEVSISENDVMEPMLSPSFTIKPSFNS